MKKNNIMDKIEISLELTNKFKKKLKGRALKIDGSFKKLDKLTKDELFLIDYYLRNQNKLISVIVPISKRYQLDFLGWNDKEYNDVLICSNWIKL